MYILDMDVGNATNDNDTHANNTVGKFVTVSESVRESQMEWHRLCVIACENCKDFGL